MKTFFFAVLFGLIFTASLEKSPEEGNMIEGDMELDPEQIAAFNEQMSKVKGEGFAAIRSNLWLTNGRADNIKYYIDPKIAGATTAISQAVADYHKYTCLRFSRQSRRPSGPHIFFTNGTGCSSPVGRRSSGNSIRLARGCWRKGTIMHEMGHSIGLFHEQSRPDRDNYVTINLHNIVNSAAFNFNKLTTSQIDSRGSPYDYDSMMHYGSKYFSKNGKITIQTKYLRDQSRIGQRNGFSTEDKIQINRMYNCVSCSDEKKSCPGWKSHCNRNNYVKTNCKKTCGIC